MIEIIPESERKMYSRKEIHEKFEGKWLYLINAEYSKSRTLIKAKVAVVADKKYEGHEEGIYLKLNERVNNPTSEYDMRDLPPSIISTKTAR